MYDYVPFLDLIMTHGYREDDFVAVFRDALKTGQFIGGPLGSVVEGIREFIQKS